MGQEDGHERRPRAGEHVTWRVHYLDGLAKRKQWQLAECLAGLRRATKTDVGDGATTEKKKTHTQAASKRARRSFV